MSNLQCAALSVAVLLIACEVRAQDVTQVDQSKTTYGEKNSSAPKELDVFSFLIGKWQGTGKARLPEDWNRCDDRSHLAKGRHARGGIGRHDCRALHDGIRKEARSNQVSAVLRPNDMR